MVYVGRIRVRRVRVGRILGKIKRNRVDGDGCEAEDKDNS